MPPPASSNQPLAGIQVVSVGSFIPAAMACARFCSLGASVTRVVPPTGDPLASLAPEWYAELSAGITVLRLDLRDGSQRLELTRLLSTADLLLTALRPRSLPSLGLAWGELQTTHPRLCHVAITGFAGPDSDHPGHDLTYQAQAGTLSPPGNPTLLIADAAGAERAVLSGLALIVQTLRTGITGFEEVSLAASAKPFASAIEAGLTRDGSLDGRDHWYRLYRSSDGWIAVAALESGTVERFRRELEIRSDAEMEDVFASRSGAEWSEWARLRGLPIEAVR